MPATIPSLWPDDIKVDVLPPLVILRVQASKIAGITQGILDAEVTTVTGHDDFVVHRLDLIAPQLDDRRYRVLTATHRADFYPVIVEAECFRPKTKHKIPHEIVEPGSEITMDVTRDVGWPNMDDWRPVANDQEEFLKRVGETLRSGAVRAMINSMIALSNAREDQPTDGVGENETAA